MPDGRYVAANSKEAKAHRAAQDTVSPVKVLLTKEDTFEEGPSFTPPPPPIGSPKTNPDQPKGKSKKAEKADEVEDLKQLVGALFAGMAVLAGSNVYRFSEPECEAVAKPLARILDRFNGAKKLVQQVADPIALFAAVALPLGVKMSIHALEKQVARQQVVSAAPVTDVRTMQQSAPPPPPPAHTNGQVPFNHILDRISEGS